MRRNRLIFYCLWILSLIGISFFGGPVSYGFFYLLTMIPIVSFLYLFAVFFLFHLYQKIDSKWLVAGQATAFYFTLVNDYFLLFSGIRVKFYSDFSSINGLDERTEYEFTPGTGVTKETTIICKYRGEYEVGIKTVIVTDFFRLFTLTYKNREPLRVIVRPALIKLSKLSGFDTNSVSSRAVASNAEPDVLVRPYAEGDDLRHVHWTESAKTGQLMVRNRIGDEKTGVAIVMSTYRCSDDPALYLPLEEKLLEIELSLVHFFCMQNITVLKVSPFDPSHSQFINEPEQFEMHYEHMSQTSFDENHKDELLLEMASENMYLMQSKAVFFVLGSWSVSYVKYLEIIAKNGVSVVVYLITDNDHPEIPNIAGVKIVPVSQSANIEEVL